MERTDNLSVTLINKQDFLQKWIDGKIEIGSLSIPLFVDVVDETVGELTNLTLPELLEQVSQANIVWLLKRHN